MNDSLRELSVYKLLYALQLKHVSVKIAEIRGEALLKKVTIDANSNKKLILREI